MFNSVDEFIAFEAAKIFVQDQLAKGWISKAEEVAEKLKETFDLTKKTIVLDQGPFK